MTTDHRPDVPVDPGASEESSVRRIIRLVGRVMALPLIGLIRVYQLFISPLTPPTCRYYPSCSAYAVTSLQRFGPIKGTWLAVRRLLRCHPWAPGGVDHVPERKPRTGIDSEQGSGPGPVPAAGLPDMDASSETRSAVRPTDPRDKGLS